MAAIRYTLENNLVAKAKHNGIYLLERLTELLDHPIVGDVRGKGLLVGVEFVKEKTTKEPFGPDEQIAARVGAQALERGLITYPGTGSVDGVAGDHVLLAPPLIVSQSHLDEIVTILDASIREVEKQVQ